MLRLQHKTDKKAMFEAKKLVKRKFGQNKKTNKKKLMANALARAGAKKVARQNVC